MATGAYYVVYIETLDDKTYEDIKNKMNLALDWFRIKEDLWMLYSTSDVEKLKVRLLPLVKSGRTPAYLQTGYYGTQRMDD